MRLQDLEKATRKVLREEQWLHKAAEEHAGAEDQAFQERAREELVPPGLARCQRDAIIASPPI